MFYSIRKFFNEAKLELTKVSWPTRQELVAATAVVIVTTFILAIFIGGTDFFLAKLLSLIIK